jgi:glycosyltransferase involved in cell wall biosynthesis
MPLEAPRSASMAFMATLLEKYPQAFCWFSLRGPGVSNPFPIPYQASAPPQRPARFLRLRQLIQYGPWAWRRGRRAAAFGRAHGVTLVLADLAFEAVIAGRVAARALGVPLLTMVHDDPVNRLRIKGLPAWFLGWYEGQFSRALTESRQTAVICDTMGETYRQRYGARPVTLFPGVEASACLPSRPLDPAKTPIVIGSVGSVTSPANWNLLVQALAALNRRHGAGKFRLLHLGAPPKNVTLSEDVEITGWLSEPDFAQALGRMDVGFLTWDFAPELAETARTSFPLKTSSYIQAQVPMLALGALDSTVVRFVQDNACGAVCITPDVESLAAQLEALTLNESAYQSAAQGVMALKDTFSRQQFFERFEQFVQSVFEH